MGGGGGFAFKRPAFPTTDFGGDCLFSLFTTLANPQIDNLKKLSVGTKLRVSISQKVNALDALNAEGELCGLIMPRFTRFASCIATGVTFEAIVVALDGAACSVLVQNAS